MKRLSEILPGSIPGNFNSYLKVKKVWNDCAGESIAFLTTVGSTKDDVLNIAVHDQTWLSEIGFLRGELINRLNQHGLEITNINFFYKAKKQSQAAKAIHKRKEMSEKEKRFADKLLATVENEELRKSLCKAIYAYFTVYTLDDYLNC
jgi:hypothetical protein